MNVTASNAVSFSATTKQGNEYKKANGGKTVGLIAGAGLSGLAIYGAHKNNASKETFIENAKKLSENKYVGKFFQKLANATEKDYEAAKKFSTKGKLAAAAVVITGATVALGAIVDKFVNHHRKRKADKAAHAE